LLFRLGVSNFLCVAGSQQGSFVFRGDPPHPNNGLSAPHRLRQDIGMDVESSDNSVNVLLELCRLFCGSPAETQQRKRFSGAPQHVCQRALIQAFALGIQLQGTGEEEWVIFNASRQFFKMPAHFVPLCAQVAY
jgi:hypothetical protein